MHTVLFAAPSVTEYCPSAQGVAEAALEPIGQYVPAWHAKGITVPGRAQKKPYKKSNNVIHRRETEKGQ